MLIGIEDTLKNSNIFSIGPKKYEALKNAMKPSTAVVSVGTKNILSFTHNWVCLENSLNSIVLSLCNTKQRVQRVNETNELINTELIPN